jgi:diguanylate cyclase (GGDEF)-like protein/PAS domain S-box-containing protein
VLYKLTGSGKQIRENNAADHLKGFQEILKISGPNLLARYTLLITIILILAGVAGCWYTVNRTDRLLRNDALKQLEMVAPAINPERIKSLGGTAADLQNPDYQRLKNLLTEINEANEKSRFVYLMDRNNNGDVFFLVDSEPPSSEDYSAPGDLYPEASDLLINIFETGTAVVEGPEIDAWGVWISALVPILDPADNHLVAIIGMDFDASTWNRDVALRAALPLGMTALSFLLLILLVVLNKNRNTIQLSRLELLKLKDFNENIVQNADEGIIVCDETGIVEFINPALAEMIGYTESELLGQHWLLFVPEHQRELARKADENRENGIDQRYSLELRHKDGTPVPVQISATPRFDAKSGKFSGSLAVMTNISNIIRAEKAIRESEEKYRLIFERSPLGVLHFDKNGVITDCNDNFVKIIGSSYQLLVGLNMLELPDKSIVKAVKRALQGEVANYENYYHSVTADKITPVRATFAPIRSLGSSFGKAEGGIGIIEDITERKAAEEKVRHMSFHDQLTNLYNRYFLEEELKRLDTVRQLPTSIIMADLNGLKLVNDTYGHLKGDQLLQKAAEIIKNKIRSEDIAARWGGDEFVILLPQTGKETADLIGKRIIEECKEAYVEDFPVSIALGTATREIMSETMPEILKKAEDSMYEQKLTESRSTKSAVLSALLNTLAAKSYETETHTRNMQEMATKIASRLGLPDSEINRLTLLITLHDIGKINIPEEILTRNSSLTESEWEIIQKHPEIGYRIALATEGFAHVAEDILSHHENFDGSGYPRRLKGKEIPLLARITAVADSYEVMSNGRPYKKAMTREAIIAEFKRCSGKQFDPELVKILLKLLT